MADSFLYPDFGGFFLLLFGVFHTFGSLILGDMSALFRSFSFSKWVPENRHSLVRDGFADPANSVRAGRRV